MIRLAVLKVGSDGLSIATPPNQDPCGLICDGASNLNHHER
jgi:hypothetical protein